MPFAPRIPFPAISRPLVHGLFLCLLSCAWPALAAPPFSGTIFVNPDIITADDTSTFTGLTDAGQGTRNEFDRRVDDFVDFQAFLFQASYSDMPNLEIQVNTEFGSTEAARVQAEQYAQVIGQLPMAVKQDLDTVTIHQGDLPYGGGDRNLLIHVGSTQGYLDDGILAETLVHETSHVSLDLLYANAPGWLAAQASDPDFISTYARDNPDREDIAESFLLWMAVRYRSDRLPQDLIDTIETTMPARLAFFDSLDLDMTPVAAPAATGPDFSSATVITPFTPFAGSYEAAETVYFRLDVPGSPAAITVSTAGDLDTFGTLFDADGNELLTDNDSGTDNNFLLAYDAAPGTYYIGVGSNSAFEAGDFTLNSTIEFVDSGTTEPDFSDATSITPNTPVFSSYGAGETVYFRLDMPAAGTFFVSTQSDLDTFGTLFAEDGTELLTDNDSGTNGNFLLEHAATPGTYYIGVGSNSAFETGEFTLIATVDFDEPEPAAPDFSNATSITPNTPAFGSLAPAGTMYFRLDVPGTTATITVNTSGDLDTFGTLFDADGTELLTDNDSGAGGNFQLLYKAAPGTYFIGVSANSAFASGDFAVNAAIEFEETSPTVPTDPVPTISKISSLDGKTRDVHFGIGAYTASGTPAFDTDFLAGDDITVIGEIMPDPADVGSNGKLYVAVLSNVNGVVSLNFIDAEGKFRPWDLTPAGLGAVKTAEPLQETHSITVFEGNLSAGLHKVYLAYSVDGGPLVYTGKALKINVTE